MEQAKIEKMDSLLKYVPFIDFLLSIDKQKYIKFTNIRKWIVLKGKNYPLSDLNKIEKSIITQYQNLLIEDKVRIPQNITTIFAPLKLQGYVNLCSDDDDDNDNDEGEQNKTNNKSAKVTKKNHCNKENEMNTKRNDCSRSTNKKIPCAMNNTKSSSTANDSDDDLEIISIDYIDKPKELKKYPASSNISKDVVSKDDDLLSDLTRELLRKIDNLEEEDCKSKARHEPNNYCYQQQDHDNNDSATTTTNNNTAGLNNGLPEEPYELFERRKDLKNEDGELFTRRTDSKSEYEHKEAAVIEKNKTVNKTDTLPKNSAEIKNDDEVVVNSLIEENHKKPYSNKTIEIISLDSGSEDESCNDKPSTSKAAVAALKAQINSDKQTHLSEITNSAAKAIVEASPGTENCISGEKIESLCDTIESAFSGQINLNELLDEIQSNQSNVEDKANKNDCSDDLMAISNKENHNIQPAKEISSQSIKDTEDFSKILQNALSNIDFQQISIAISHVKSNMIGNNASNANSSESPPPPAPPISRNVITTLPLNTALQQQQPQHQMTHIMYPNVIGQPPFQSFCHVPYIPMPAQQLITPTYNPIKNVPQVIPPRPTVNIKDPRIQKQLQAIQKSPLINCNLINPLVADSIMNICRSNADQQMPKPSHQQQQQNILSNKTSAEGVVVERNRRKSTSETTASAISYGEYKRRKLEKLLEAERLREQEKAAKLEKLKADEVRSKIISTLNPCKDQITSLWSRHKTVVTNTIHHRDCDSEVGEEAVVRNGENLVEKSNTSSSPSNNSENKTISPSESKEKKQRDKRRRLDLNLRCTVKGFDQVECFQHLKERRSSIQAREHIRQQLNVDRFEDTTSERISLADMPETVSPTRRLSVPAHPTITDQPSGSQRKEIHGDHPHQPIGSKRCYPQFTGIDSALDLTGNNCSTGAPTLKRRKTIDEIHKPKSRCRSLRLEDSSSNSDDGDDDDESFEKLKKLKETVIKNPGYVKLERISREFIRKHTKSKDIEGTPNLLDVHLVQFTIDDCENPKKTEESNSRKNKMPRKLNNDCQMTERNTRFCVLCTSKPSDLTNHYVRRHKTESYVARLDWAELDDLIISTPFAKLQPSNGRNINRYAVTCPFCKEEVVETFMSLYNHYASHTGEFAYQCGHCNLLKPYRADIQSHMLHSKACRNSQVQIIYRYPPAAQCIYLHYCNICNFVQLNEANITKHIREHHHSTKAIAANVGKCILAAMSDVPAENNTAGKALSPEPSSSSSFLADTAQKQRNSIAESHQPKAELNFKVEDDNVPVSNEPCPEEIFEENNTSPEEQLKQMHEDLPPNVQEPPPMTVIHYTKNLRIDSTEFNHVRTQLTNATPITPQRVLPMPVKVEQLEINERQIQIPTRSALNTVSLIQHTHSMANSQPEGYTTYEKYRCYPETVNYLGLYKCMIDDCYYSTDCTEEFLKHLTDHALDTTTTNEYLQCPYCIIPVTSGGNSLTAQELVEHVRREHQHMIYQCSMCCYRSCEGSNVLIHQKSHHNNDLKACKIFKCIAHVKDRNRRQEQMDLNELIKKNVYKVSCSICELSFYNSNLLVRHLTYVHNISDASLLKIYSCIYCPLTDNDINQLRIHVANKHPGEIPQLYDRNGQVHKTEDCLTSLNIINLSESVPCIEVAPVVNENMDANVQQDPKDIKPDLEQLQQMNEETIKVRLRKLTNHTGIAPDTLYRCPIDTCGGFFSVYDLWLKHMKLRHCALECECPHCPNEPAGSSTMLSLDSFRLHFEKHRRHTFVCFYCTFTCSNEQAAREHGLQEHSSFGQMRFEKIRFNINYSYSIMLQNSLFPQREDFINELLIILEKRLIDMEAIEKQKLKHQWPLSRNIDWLEDFPKLLTNHNVNLRCLIKSCKYRSPNETILFQHVNTAHEVTRTAFNCSTCNYRLEPFTLQEFYNHIKTHTTSSFICAACSLQTSSRSKLSAHIRDQHAARDVPVVYLFTVEQQIYHKIYIVFANDCLTFSTMKNCFCCTERNICGNAYSLHLKRYHNLALNYYCEGCTKFLFKSLKEVKGHFEEFHKGECIKIRCELSAQKDLIVLSLNEFQVQISNEGHQQEYKSLQVNIKDEPYDSSDDCVILLEDDDIAIENSLKDKANTQEKPLLKCKSFNNLIAVNDNNRNNNVVPQTNGSIQQIIERNQVTLPPLNGFNGQTSYNGHHYNNLLTTNTSNTYNVVTNPIYNVCSSNTTTMATLSNHDLPIVAQNVTSNGNVNNTCGQINQTRFIQ